MTNQPEVLASIVVRTLRPGLLAALLVATHIIMGTSMSHSCISVSALSAIDAELIDGEAELKAELSKNVEERASMSGLKACAGCALLAEDLESFFFSSTAPSELPHTNLMPAPIKPPPGFMEAFSDEEDTL